ncbi:hypothetical protein [Nocardia crassostreae]|uniref:hypothetical protein n=1 Tax=Nocardia crassostreae TaxID=53428 RepID=UPI00082D775B|nr:hypothetical protein [Nocardia crassostreae]
MLARAVVAGAITIVPVAALAAPATAAPSVSQVVHDSEKPKCRYEWDMRYDHHDRQWEHDWVWVCPDRDRDDHEYDNNPNR